MARAPDVLLMSQSGQFGGMEKRLLDEAAALRSLSYAPTVSTNSFPGSDMIRRRCAEMDVPYVPFSPPDFMQEWRWRHLYKARAFVMSRRYWQQTRPQLCHIFLPWTDQGLAHLWLAARFKIKTVLSVHNTFPGARFVPWHDRHVREAMKSVLAVYAVSDSALMAFERCFQSYLSSDTHLRTIENFVDVARFVPSSEMRAETRRALGIPEHAMAIGSVGRLAYQKRPQSIVTLFARLRQTVPNLYLILCGQGHLEDAARRLADSLEVAPYVRFTGFITRPETIYPALDLHVLLSRNEGFGISTIEAMACGVPVIGTDVPGTRDILHGSDAGFLVPLNDEDAATQAAICILEDAELRQRFGQAGRQLACARFSKTRWMDEIARFYEDVFTRIGDPKCA